MFDKFINCRILLFEYFIGIPMYTLKEHFVLNIISLFADKNIFIYTTAFDKLYKKKHSMIPILQSIQKVRNIVFLSAPN